MTLTDDDLNGVLLPHDDLLVVTLNTGGYDVVKILVGGGSAVDVIFKHAFVEMDISQTSLKFVLPSHCRVHRSPDQLQWVNVITGLDWRNIKS